MCIKLSSVFHNQLKYTSFSITQRAQAQMMICAIHRTISLYFIALIDALIVIIHCRIALHLYSHGGYFSHSQTLNELAIHIMSFVVC